MAAGSHLPTLVAAGGFVNGVDAAASQRRDAHHGRGAVLIERLAEVCWAVGLPLVCANGAHCRVLPFSL